MARLQVHYATVPGQRLVLQRPDVDDVPLDWGDGGWWHLDIDLADGDRYRYALSTDGVAGTEPEGAGAWRSADGTADVAVDRWSPVAPLDRPLGSSMFRRVIRRRSATGAVAAPPERTASHRFRILAPDLDVDRRLVLVGDSDALGNWDPVDGVALRREFPWWTADVELSVPSTGLAYKYVVVGGEPGGVTWEEGPDRIVPPTSDRPVTVTDQGLGWRGEPWRGAGIVLPLFSLRVRGGGGVGRYTDLEPFADWAAAAGLSVIQLLPLNDTTLTHGPEDSYPYSPISSVALHPLYVDTGRIGRIRDAALAAELADRRRLLDAAPGLDHTALMDVVWRELRALFDQFEPSLASNAEFARFAADEADWLDDYAAFCVLRDAHGPDRSRWGDHRTHDPERLARLLDPAGPHAREVTFHRWVQWHLHLQLDAAADHARRLGVALKGDLPIGVSPDSADVWAAPELFDPAASVGAPPDDFSASGQNWEFPVYRWDVMARDGYGWWRRRLAAMGRAFDAYRIDHVLGFFRIWKVPIEQVEGTLGRFEPCLPLSEAEIRSQLGWFDHDRLCRPRLTRSTLEHHLDGDRLDELVGELLVEVDDDRYELVPELATQRAIEARYADDPRLPVLLRLPAELLLLEVTGADGAPGYHPRVDPARTRSFHDLDEADRHRWMGLVNDFFHHRHGELWKRWGLTTLPAVLDASDLLVCGEDLGVVPDFVPGVLRELGVLTLEIERMPKQLGSRIADPAAAPELSVVATGTHDMATMRTWWETERAQAADVWRAVGRSEAPPADCGPDVATTIVRQHLDSPAQWAILPFQDLVAMDGDLRHPDSAAEQINVPANPKHVWSYRMHVTIDDLLEHPITRRLREMVQHSGRALPG
ncbi:MAG: 4-alpha-glucanotransferase [Actinomycetota bacterium]